MPPRLQLARAQPSARAFSTSSTCLRHRRTNILSLLPEAAPLPPPYPYPLARWYKQQNTGLYGGATLQYGNHVSEDHDTKARRRWIPNIHTKHFYSRALDRRLRLRVSARVLRTIERIGGIDSYVLGHSTQRVKDLGPEGWKLRWVILHTPKMQAEMASNPNLRRLTGPRNVPTQVMEEQDLAAPEDIIEGLEVLEEDTELEREAEYAEQSKDGIPGGIYRPQGGHMAEAPPPPAPQGVFGRLRATIRGPSGGR